MGGIHLARTRPGAVEVQGGTPFVKMRKTPGSVRRRCRRPSVRHDPGERPRNAARRKKSGMPPKRKRPAPPRPKRRAMQDPTRFLGEMLLLLGALGLLAGFVACVFRRRARGARTFPRSKAPGWVLTAAGTCLGGVGDRARRAGRFEAVKPLVPILAVLSFGAIVYFLDSCWRRARWAVC
jgi:hypothetical protein